MSDLPSSRALARAVEDASKPDAIAIRRQRRWIAITALIELFQQGKNEGLIPAFLVKGGFALELRFRKEARASRDLDLVVPLSPEQVLDAVVRVLRLNWSGFRFSIKGEPERREHSYKFEVNASYKSVAWSTFEVELVFDEITDLEIVEPPNLESYGLLSARGVPCMTACEQIAQKLHAVSDAAENRPRDLIDIYLCATRLAPDVVELRSACVRKFDKRATHSWPPTIEAREGWAEALEGLIAKSELQLTVEEVVGGVQTSSLDSRVQR